MLIIRESQLDVFRREALRRFVERMVVHLREAFPEARERPDGELRQMVQKGISKAEGYGLTEADEVEAYLEAMVVFGEDFDETPWAAPVLRRADLSGTEKLELLDDFALWLSCRGRI